MHRLMLFVIALGSLGLSQSSLAQEPAPYLYYYSAAENAFVIERADGTDRQRFAKDISPKQSRINPLGGAGWSPDGQWFGWITTYYADQIIYRSGHVISTDGQEALSIFRQVENMYAMHWSPDSQYLLLNLSPTCRSVPNYCAIDTYWLIDVANNALIALFDITQMRAPTAVEWTTQDGQVDIYLWEEAWGQSPTIGYHRVTMHIDGRVEKQPITHEAYEDHTPTVAELVEVPEMYLSPDGDYIVNTKNSPGFIQNNVDNTTIPVPILKFNSRNTMIPVNAQWSANSEWILGGFSDHNGVYGIGVFKLDGSYARELTACGSSAACAGWLPDNVDLSAIGANRHSLNASCPFGVG